jgi:hypothetical protein
MVRVEIALYIGRSAKVRPPMSAMVARA